MLLPYVVSSFVARMKLRFWRHTLQLAHRWTIARALRPDGTGGDSGNDVVFVELTDNDGVVGYGEAAPSDRYDETADGVIAFLEHLNPYQLSFSDLEGSRSHVQGVAPGNFSAKGAVGVALLDGAARRARKPLHDYLGVGFKEGQHLTSFSIGIDTPSAIRSKVVEAKDYPILKLKLGSPSDRENLRALREVAPHKPVRVDANEAWQIKEEALRNLEWLASDGHVEFVEQPMPASADPAELKWLKERSPLPLMADEGYVYARDVDRCQGCYDSVNVKLTKSGGVHAAVEALRAARRAGFKTMLGCMIESSVLISAAAHLAQLTDYLDLDGHLLVTNDPFEGVDCTAGRVSFANAAEKTGLQVRTRSPRG